MLALQGVLSLTQIEAGFARVHKNQADEVIRRARGERGGYCIPTCVASWLLRPVCPLA
jgi:hypothetical protein